MNKRLQFISLSVWCMAALVGVAAALSAGKCEPDCSTKSPGTLVEDPQDCTRYYICVADNVPTDQPVPCSAGEKFDITIPGCTPTTTPCTPTCQPAFCDLSCDRTSAVDEISDPLNCNIYHVCSAGNVVLQMACPETTPYFDGNNKVCSDDQSVCCTDVCVPYCHPGIVQTMDPANCTNFYICTNVGPVDPALHFTCGPGSSFDVTVSTCVKGAQCKTVCGTGEADTTVSTPVTGGTTTPTASTTATPTSGSVTTTTATPTSGSVTTTTATPTSSALTTTTTTPTSSAVTTTTAMVTTTTSPAVNCTTSMTCSSVGVFAMCSYCQPEYFRCSQAGQPATVHTCPGTLLFNPDPSYPYCVLSTDCPQHSPQRNRPH